MKAIQILTCVDCDGYTNLYVLFDDGSIGWQAGYKNSPAHRRYTCKPCINKAERDKRARINAELWPEGRPRKKREKKEWTGNPLYKNMR